MTARAQLICLWGGPVTMVLFFLGFAVIAGFIPPPGPGDSAEQVAAFYAENSQVKTIGLLVTVIAGACTAPFIVAIGLQMRRIGKHAEVYAITQIGLGMIGVLLFVLPPMMMIVGTFRVRDPELVQLINDATFIPLVALFSPALLQNLCIAAAVLSDREGRIFPRWVAYFNVLATFAFMPAGMVVFFPEGPFSWGGIFGFYIPMTDFFIWYITMFVVTRRAILRMGREEDELARGLRVEERDVQHV